MGFGTNRVVTNKQLNKTNLSQTQIKGMNMLKSICDVKKQPSAEEKKKAETATEEKKRPRLKNLLEHDNLAEKKTENRMMVDESKENKVEISEEKGLNE